ncbi:MAG: ABC transporter ATP-binding protein [bacterium]|nr:ABC transporter ATP-binding protein [bacterium]
MKPIIIAENVSKKYSRNANAHLSYGLFDLVRELAGRGGSLELRKDEFFAVNDVSFHMYPGDTLALIGRNGSGKTTLLKMLNGLIKPDAGTIMVEGLMQALINLGAGFNMNLSGRENVFNLAALYGFSRVQTSVILDEIIDFSGLEEFIDSPVYSYSKGMQARLGFSVVVHLRPDILLIDEILSVGDFAFQNKCFTKMHELKKNGVTIVLVSHSHTHVVQLCDNALWINRGRLTKLGVAKEVVQDYLNFLDQEEVAQAAKARQLKRDAAQATDAPPAKSAANEIYGPVYNEMDKVEDLRVEFFVHGRPTDHLQVHDELTIRYSFRLRQPVTDLNVSLVFARKDGLRLTTISTLNDDLLKHIHEGVVRCEVRIPDFHFNPGSYVLVMPIHEGKSYLYRDVVKEFVVRGDGRLTWQLTDLTYNYTVLEE